MSRIASTPEVDALARRPRRAPRVALEARLGIGVMALAAATLVGPSDRTSIITLLVGVYLPYVVAITHLERHRGPLARSLGATADLLVVSVFAVAIPDVRVVALLGYGLATTYHAVTSGARVGAISAALAVVLAALTEVLGPGDGLGGFTIAMFAAVQAALVRTVTVLVRERRELAVQLARLDVLVSRQSRAPDRTSTLAALAAGLIEVLGADGGRVTVDGAPEDEVVPAFGSDAARHARGEHRAEHGTPPPHAIANDLDGLIRGAREAAEPVVLRRRTGHKTGRPWSRRLVWAAAVPLRTAVGDLGGVAVWGRGGLAPTDEALLVAFADHGAAALLRDRADHQQRHALRRLEEVELIRDEVISTLSHEVRTPLTATTGYLHILDTYWDRLDAGARRAMVSQARDSAEVLGRQVARLMDFARLERQTRLAAPEPIDLAGAVRRAVDRRAALLARHPVRVMVPPGCSVLADGEALDRALGNLLENAAAYTPPDSAVHVDARRDGDTVTVTVRDHGPGIAPDDLPHVFDPLFRGHQPQPGIRGTGTGLTVVRRLVELLGGRVWVESEPGQGATFGFTLPVDAPLASDPIARASG